MTSPGGLDLSSATSQLTPIDPVQDQALGLISQASGGGGLNLEALAQSLTGQGDPDLLGAVSNLLGPLDAGRLQSRLPQAGLAAGVETLSGGLAPVTSIGGVGALVGHSLETPQQRQVRQMDDALQDQQFSQMVGQAQLDQVLEPYLKLDRAPQLTPAAQDTAAVVDKTRAGGA